MARSSRQALRELDSSALEPITARRSIKRIRRICQRRLRRNLVVTILVLLPPIVLGLTILWGDHRFVPYVWRGARGILLALWVVALIGGLVTWVGMLLSTIEQYRVLGRLKQEEDRIQREEQETES